MGYEDRHATEVNAEGPCYGAQRNTTALLVEPGTLMCRLLEVKGDEELYVQSRSVVWDEDVIPS